MNDINALILQSEIIGIKQELRKIGLSILEDPPDDATCESCRWFSEDKKILSHEEFDGSCVKSGRVFTGELYGVRWHFPSAHKTDPCCRHWREK